MLLRGEFSFHHIQLVAYLFVKVLIHLCHPEGVKVELDQLDKSSRLNSIYWYILHLYGIYIKHFLTFMLYQAGRTRSCNSYLATIPDSQ